MKEFISKTLEDTSKIAQEFSKKLSGGDVVFLVGDLGAGKTAFSKSLALELGVKQDVVSPTFTLLNIYETENNMLCHFDLYRLENVEELQMLNFEDYFYNEKAISLIEWPQILSDYSFQSKYIVKIEKISEFERKFVIGEKNENIVY